MIDEITDDMRDAEHERLRDLDYEASTVLCPACGQHGCDKVRDYGKGQHADFECDCGWRFRADRFGNVMREFGREAVSA